MSRLPHHATMGLRRTLSRLSRHATMGSRHATSRLSCHAAISRDGLEARNVSPIVNDKDELLRTRDTLREQMRSERKIRRQ